LTVGQLEITDRPGDGNPSMVIPPDKLLPVRSVVEIPLDSGRYAYAQNLENGYPVPIVRVLPGLFEGPLPLPEIEQMAESDDTQFLVQFPLMLLIDSRRGRVVTRQVPPEQLCRRPPLRQFVRPSAANPNGWYVIDADGLDRTETEFAALHPEVDQRDLSLWSVPGTGLFLRMVKAGWTPGMAKDRNLGF
jgi:hypothetical protein